MSDRPNGNGNGTMLELWRPPQAAGDPIGCLATTFTFSPALFDEQCLARFLEIESEPNREDLAFLLERETRLGGVYAGVLVDQTRSGVEHSLRWDVLPVRIRGGKQHAKLSLLVWARHIRIIVSSANLTDPGYRTNYEIAAGVDLSPDDSDSAMLVEAVEFLRNLLALVPGAANEPPEVRRATIFLKDVLRRARGWSQRRRREGIRQQLVCTLPARSGVSARSSLEEIIQACRARGISPHEAWIASPFFDAEVGTSRATASLCRQMARGRLRKLSFAVPAVRDGNEGSKVPRLAAPPALLTTVEKCGGSVAFEVLPDSEDTNHRPWHAKMLALLAAPYSALMIELVQLYLCRAGDRSQPERRDESLDAS